MVSIGIDIGTTKLCAIAIDVHNGNVLETLTKSNRFIPANNASARRQDPAYIWSVVEKFYRTLLESHSSISGMGITCQMHGIVYLDSQGEAVSDLFTWQDKAADECAWDGGSPYTRALEDVSGYPSHTGYGATTYYTHVQKQQMPSNAVALCCIGDYISMKLTGRSAPLQHTSNAAGLGLFNLDALAFDTGAISKAGLDPSLFPAVTDDYKAVGCTDAGIPVCVCIGDNQASFAGAVSDAQNSIFVNVGTGSQVSIVTKSAQSSCDLLEVRPYVDGLNLCSGSSLCGGSALALLERFYRSVARMAGIENGTPLYDAMMEALDQLSPDEPALQVSTQFLGTRADPSLRGTITGIGANNFDPANLTRGFLRGITEELHVMYCQMKNDHHHTKLVAAGNGVRKTLPLQHILAEMFGAPLLLPLHREEAAYGAALFATVCVDLYPTLAAAQSIIQYEPALTRKSK